MVGLDWVSPFRKPGGVSGRLGPVVDSSIGDGVSANRFSVEWEMISEGWSLPELVRVAGFLVDTRKTQISGESR